MPSLKAKLAKKLKVAIVGLGNAGKMHAQAFGRNEHCELKYFCDIDHPTALTAAREFYGVKVVTDYEKIVNDKSVDIISIATYDSDHFAQVIPALERGKHLFVEKPLCRSIKEAKAIRNAWEKGGRPVLESNPMSRGSKLYNWLSTLIERGGLGTIYAIDAEYWYGRLHKITDGWRKDVENYSVLQGGAIHLLDVAFMLTQERPNQVMAMGNRIVTAESDFRYDDFTTAMFRFPSSMILRLTANFGCVHKHQHILRVFGTQATFLLDDTGARLHATRDSITSGLKEGASPALPIDLPYKPPHKGELIKPFVELIVSGADPSALLQRNLDVVTVLASADKASHEQKEGKIIYV